LLIQVKLEGNNPKKWHCRQFCNYLFRNSRHTYNVQVLLWLTYVPNFAHSVPKDHQLFHQKEIQR